MEIVKEEKTNGLVESPSNDQDNLRSVRKNAKNGPKVKEELETLKEETFDEFPFVDLIDVDESSIKFQESENEESSQDALFEEVTKTPTPKKKRKKKKPKRNTDSEDESDDEPLSRKKQELDFENNSLIRTVKQCDVCSLPFRYATSLLAHRNLEHPDVPTFTCSECKKELETWAQYEKHLKKHREPDSEIQTIKCDVCFKEYEYINSFIQHRRVTHPERKIYICTICHNRFTVYKDYKSHLRLSHKDSGIKLSLSGLICDICGKEFLCHYNLSNHRKHHGSPQFKCEICNKLFKTKKSLNCHTRIHTGEKPYTCEQCGKSFPGKSYLINHNITHSGQKPFVCEVCGKAFSKKWNMIQHERIHTGERPYKCPICTQGFIQNFLLKDHMKKAHNRDLKEFAKPPENYDVPPENFEGPPENFDTPPENFDTPPENFDTPPENFDRPPEDFDR